MKIAIVGTGIAGLTASYLLARRHQITVFEAKDRIGGHTHTVAVELDDETHQVDTGFIVFNSRTYPNFERLLRQLGVRTQDTSMSFSVRCERSDFEYNGTSLNRLFAQRRNLLSPAFHRMISDIVRFNRRSRAWLASDTDDLPFGEYLRRGGYGGWFIDRYIVPMGAAIWSALPASITRFPARFFLRFFDNHGMLSVDDRPTWRVVRGGSARYVEALSESFRDSIRLRAPVLAVRRDRRGVEVAHPEGRERFDAVVLAPHSDDSLALLEDPSREEREILGAIPYQTNQAVLHSDDRLLPRRRLARACWNYHLHGERSGAEPVAVTYSMNRLQGLRSRHELCVTLNQTELIEPAKILRTMSYRHPVFTPASLDAQLRYDEIGGQRRTYYCGAYWGNGFHEDGVNSALAVASGLGVGFDERR